MLGVMIGPQNGYCDAYNIGQNIGTEAGQTVMSPRTFDSKTQRRYGRSKVV